MSYTEGIPGAHPDDQLLIPGSTTPTGFGIFWFGETAQVRATSPCCGGFMLDYQCICYRCGTSWKPEVERNGATVWLNFDISTEDHTWCRWVQNLTGLKDVRIIRHSS